jgi:hypothetical protein
MGTWLSLGVPYGRQGSQAKIKQTLIHLSLGIGSQAFQLLWLSSWAHGYPHGLHVESREAKPRANPAPDNSSWDLEARPSTS